MLEPPEVTLRRLPGGSMHGGQLRSRRGPQLKIELQGEPYEPFTEGMLLEIDDAKMLYLGLLLSCQGGVMSVWIEHIADVERVARIRDAWRQTNAS